MKVTGATFRGTYEAARSVASFSAGVGWVVIIVAAAIAVASVLMFREFAFLGVAIGVLIAVAGLIQVAVAQGVRAAVDTADYARQSLKLQIAQAEGRGEVELRSGSLQPASSAISASSSGQQPGAAPAIGSLNDQEFAALDERSARAYIRGMRDHQRWEEQDALLGAWYRLHKTSLPGV